MQRRFKILGAPGTGKTTTLHKIIDFALGQRESPPFSLPQSFPTNLEATDIAFVSFTNTAIDVIGKRTGITPRSKEAPYMRTIHGLILSALKDHFKPEEIEKLSELVDAQAEFSAKMGYYYSKDPFEMAEGNMKFNEITRVIETYLPKLQDVEACLDMIEDSETRRFAKAWMIFKRKKKLMDFDDILIRGYEYLDELIIPVKVAFIDEAQDNGPLDFILLERAFENAEFVFIAGDPLQSIYWFKGANPKLFVKWKAHKLIVLPKSPRLPNQVWILAQSWALSLGIPRAVAKYQPSGREGRVTRMHFMEALNYAIQKAREGKHVLILARTNALVRFIGNILSIEFGVAFGHLKRPSYWESHLLRFIEGIKLLKMWDGRTPIKVSDTKPITGLIRKLKNPDKRKILGEWRDHKRPWDLEVYTILLELKRNPLAHFYLTDFDKQAIKAYFTKAKLDLTDKLIVDTIHAAKGEEAQIVLFMDFIPTRSEERIEPNTLQEKLVAYVGFTRASEELIIVPTPQIKYHPMRPYVGEEKIKSVVMKWKPKALVMLGGD